MEKPLALKLAPNSIDEVIGQKHLLSSGKVLRNLVENKKIFSMIYMVLQELVKLLLRMLL